MKKNNMFKKRKICFRCSAKKYTKYLRYLPVDGGGQYRAWICINKKYCRNRSANYRK